MANRFLVGFLSVALLGLPLSASAQDDEAAVAVEEDPSELGEPGADEPLDYQQRTDEGSGLLGDEQAEIEEDEPQEEFRDGTDPFEEEDQDYFFLGAMYRQVIIPGFIQGLFVEGGIDGFNPGTGLMFNWRKNNFNVIAEAWWNNAQGQGFFRAQGDDITETEFIEANLFVIFVNASFLWSFPITDWFAIDLGFDLGVGFVGGTLTRTEARATDAGETEFEPCPSPGAPDVVGRGYCEPVPAPDPCYNNPGGHYNCVEPDWTTEGGDTPLVMPWVTLPHLAIRIKPIHQLQIRIDGGYGLYNFFFGGSVAYGF